mmetsp:Transcript_17703/g.20511  ORF Transcript_17703/g.20511 Transcript_17703/m.20511 type:complete len:162 (-) Transcript_17703:46-531(-)
MGFNQDGAFQHSHYNQYMQQTHMRGKRPRVPTVAQPEEPQTYINNGVKRLRLNTPSNFHFGPLPGQRNNEPDDENSNVKRSRMNGPTTFRFGPIPGAEDKGNEMEISTAECISTPDINRFLRQLHFERKAREMAHPQQDVKSGFQGGCGTPADGRFQHHQA